MLRSFETARLGRGTLRAEWCKTPATYELTTGDGLELRCDGYYTVWAYSALRVLSSSPGFLRNHDDNNKSSSTSCVGTDDVRRSAGE